MTVNKVTLSNPQQFEDVPKINEIQDMIDQMVGLGASNNKPIDLNIYIVDKTESARLNKEFRQKDYPTNVLSFPHTPIPGFNDENLLGDLILCADVIAEEAEQQNKYPRNHWGHMVMHGLLHLLGYDHETENEAEQMEMAEAAFLNYLGYANPWKFKNY